ncbi:MAG TPA: hypothetical protein VFA26_23310 [Gemmataceae bacterium]|nr:hypothetical protein [Gemmataceae bacterium]
MTRRLLAAALALFTLVPSGCWCCRNCCSSCCCAPCCTPCCSPCCTPCCSPCCGPSCCGCNYPPPAGPVGPPELAPPPRVGP